MTTILDSKIRYLQLAFNDGLADVRRVLPQVAPNPRILIETGTPFIRREGVRGIQVIRRNWPGSIVADLKVTDGALWEVAMVHDAGATAATVMGSSPVETLDLSA
jgi:3-keto-L-gulonate-6-phosphate decarboxylase